MELDDVVGLQVNGFLPNKGEFGALIYCTIPQGQHRLVMGIHFVLQQRLLRL